MADPILPEAQPRRENLMTETPRPNDLTCFFCFVWCFSYLCRPPTGHKYWGSVIPASAVWESSKHTWSN